MKAVVQRVARADVAVEGETVGAIERGALVLLGVMKGDGEDEARRLALKVARFRYFADGDGKMNLSALDLLAEDKPAELLVVSQFTLAADGRRGRRPSFDSAAPPALAEPLYREFCAVLREQGLRVETGVFGAHMRVSLVNDGPVTFALEEPPPAGGPDVSG